MNMMAQFQKQTVIHAQGKDWTLGPWGTAAWTELLQLAKPHLPDPYDALGKLLQALPPEEARSVLLEAQKEKRRILSISSPAVQEWLRTLEGELALFYVLLKVTHPDMTSERAMAIA